MREVMATVQRPVAVVLPASALGSAVQIEREVLVAQSDAFG